MLVAIAASSRIGPGGVTARAGLSLEPTLLSPWTMRAALPFAFVLLLAVAGGCGRGKAAVPDASNALDAGSTAADAGAQTDTDSGADQTPVAPPAPCGATDADCGRSRCCLDPADVCGPGTDGSTCQPVPPLPRTGDGCNGGKSSDLPGVELRFTDESCTFTQAQVAAGIAINYQLIVAENLTDIFVEPLDIGRCQKPDPQHGLIVSFVIEGGRERNCLCDTAFCGVARIRSGSKPGTYPGAVNWDGRNWAGPSDVSSPKGPAFPPGTYVVMVRAQGTRRALNMSDVPYQVLARRFITITP
jgi:hypothetical protein